MEEFTIERLHICEKCGIYNKAKTQCSPNLYINPENNDVSVTAKEGYTKGCGCFIPNKIKRESTHCPAGKW